MTEQLGRSVQAQPTRGSSSARVVPPALQIDLADTADRVADFLRDRLAVAGLDTYVLGLSGGVDSACSAALAVRAVGADRLLTVKLPSRSSSPASQRDAELVEESLAIPPEHRLLVQIGPLVDGWRGAVGDTEPHPLRIGNVAARSRMVVLWDLAMKHGGIVLGTENRTESLLGYFTIYGDAGTAVEPIAPLYKTQVWALAGYLGLPDTIITKDPTADLWAGQTDEGELGVSYLEADQVLYWAVDRGLATSEVRKQTGLSEMSVARVLRRFQETAYKRELPYRMDSSSAGRT
jgi:NAD+ synthase